MIPKMQISYQSKYFYTKMQILVFYHLNDGLVKHLAFQPFTCLYCKKKWLEALESFQLVAFTLIISIISNCFFALYVFSSMGNRKINS